MGGSHWTGGSAYLQNLLDALVQYAPRLHICLLLKDGEDGLKPRLGDPERIARIRLPWSGKRTAFLNRIIRRLSGYDLALRLAACKSSAVRLDVFFPACYRANRSTAVLNWIPDFQHLHLPNMFDRAELKARNRGYSRAIRLSTRTVLSSEDALRDFRRFAPGAATKARVMRFVANIPQGLFESNPLEVVSRHRLPAKFFFLPNQFWRHKNHEIVFEALQILRAKDIRPVVVCTGKAVDPRNPTYYSQLLDRIRVWRVEDQVKFLGLVPHDDVYQLLRQSVCLINPSLFEGWSTSVEEAKSVGKGAILSDLQVHREQNSPEAEFFKPTDSAALAELMRKKWCGNQSGPDWELEARAREELPRRMKNFAESFCEIAEEAVCHARGATMKE